MDAMGGWPARAPQRERVGRYRDEGAPMSSEMRYRRTPYPDDRSLSPEDLAPGVVVRSMYSYAKRTVVAIDGDNVILRLRTGSIESLPITSVCRFWRVIDKADSKE